MKYRHVIDKPFCIAALLLVAACGDKAAGPTPTAATSESAKSIAYYSAHIDEAKQMKANCERMAVNELSTMSESQQRAWRETVAGINCANAKEAVGQFAYDEYQRKMIESTKNFK